MFYTRVILWKQGLHQTTQNCQVYRFSGPDKLVSYNKALSVTLKYLQTLQNGINDPKGLDWLVGGWLVVLGLTAL